MTDRLPAWLGGVGLASLFLLVLVLALIKALGWWTLPLFFLAVTTAATVWSALRARRTHRIRQLTEVAVIDTMSPAGFERHIADLLTRDGCLRVQVVGGRGDGGVDVLARTSRMARIAVQCKHYPTRAVGPAAVRDFNGCAWSDHRADIALFVTSGRFTTAALEFGQRHRIQMIDRVLLARWMAGDRILPRAARTPATTRRGRASDSATPTAPGEPS